MPEGVSVRIYRPSPPLQSYVTFFYFVGVETPIADFLYPEWGNVRFALSGKWRVQMPDSPPLSLDFADIFGPTDRRGLIFTSAGTVVGFGLTPLGWHAIVREDASLMTNRIAPLRRQIGQSGAAIREQLLQDASDQASVARLERILTDRIASHPPISDLVKAIDAALRQGPVEVAQFAAMAGVSERTLQRACLNYFGFAPKRLLRLQRFLDTLGRIRSAVGEPLADGLGSSYYDQPQFYRDFRDFMKMTPREYYGSERQLMATAAAAQVEAGVTLSFALPPPPD